MELLLNLTWLLFTFSSILLLRDAARVYKFLPCGFSFTPSPHLVLPKCPLILFESTLNDLINETKNSSGDSSFSCIPGYCRISLASLKFVEIFFPSLLCMFRYESQDWAQILCVLPIMNSSNVCEKLCLFSHLQFPPVG